ncbi:MAG: hypothetical protein KDD70_06675 [Bdellovibrionales bacterium]|nr:hypothetical protein [Bdellovibrionales bacterium]
MARIVSNPLDAVRQFSDVCQEIDSIGKVCVALPDLDPDAVLSQNFFSQEQLGSGVEVEIYSGDGKGLAVRNRLPDFADMKLFPIERLSDAYDQDPHVPIVLMDASTLHQRNVGLGRTDIVPHVVLDTHVSKEEVRAQRFAVVSDQHVATGSIITEYAKALFGDGHEVWADPEMRKNVAALRFGIHTDTGEGNYPTKRDRRADLFLEERQDGEYFEHLKNSLFFQKVKVIDRIANGRGASRKGLFFAELDPDDFRESRDYLGAVADRRLNHYRPTSVLIVGVLEEGNGPQVCVSLRLNRWNKFFDEFRPEGFLHVLEQHGGGFGSQINGEVWGGTVRNPPHPYEVIHQLKTAYFQYADAFDRHVRTLEAR